MHDITPLLAPRRPEPPPPRRALVLAVAAGPIAGVAMAAVLALRTVF